MGFRASPGGNHPDSPGVAGLLCSVSGFSTPRTQRTPRFPESCLKGLAFLAVLALASPPFWRGCPLVCRLVLALVPGGSGLSLYCGKSGIRSFFVNRCPCPFWFTRCSHAKGAKNARSFPGCLCVLGVLCVERRPKEHIGTRRASSSRWHALLSRDKSQSRKPAQHKSGFLPDGGRNPVEQALSNKRARTGWWRS